MPANWWVFYVLGDADYWQDPEYVAGVAETEDSSEDGGWWIAFHNSSHTCAELGGD
jgi:hypothetical protein